MRIPFARYLIAAAIAALPAYSAFADDYRPEVAVALHAALNDPAAASGAEIGIVPDTGVMKGAPRYCVRVQGETYQFLIMYGQAVGPFPSNCEGVAWTEFKELSQQK